MEDGQVIWRWDEAEAGILNIDDLSHTLFHVNEAKMTWII